MSTTTDFQLFMPYIHNWIQLEQLKLLWKLSNSSVNSLSQSIQYDQSRLENLSWRLWHYQQQQQINIAHASLEHLEAKKEHQQQVSCSATNKFYLDTDDEVEELTDDEGDDDSEIGSWSYSIQEEEEEEDLVFEKKTSSENNILYATPLQQQQKPVVSLLTQMLQQQQQQQPQQNNYKPQQNNYKPPQTQQQQQHDGLRRCQSKFHSLDEWFANTSS